MNDQKPIHPWQPVAAFLQGLKSDPNEIPIAFEYNGKLYSGELSKVSGFGSSAMFHLMIDSYYQGQLVNTENYGWQFHSKDGTFEEMGKWFGEYVTAFDERINKNQ